MRFVGDIALDAEVRALASGAITDGAPLIVNTDSTVSGVAITGTAAQGDASQIGGIPTAAAASMQAVTGPERTAAAADMMAIVADLPDEITAAISEDPATVQAQIDTGADPQVTAAVAALPQEALVSVQMEQLLAGMEDGKTPAWA